MSNFKKEDFNLSSKELADALMMGKQGIIDWAEKGAFPFSRSKGEKAGRYYFHKSCTDLSLKEIKENINLGKYKEPIYRLWGKANTTSNSTQKYHELKKVNKRLDDVERSIMGILNHLDIEFSDEEE